MKLSLAAATPGRLSYTIRVSIGTKLGKMAEEVVTFGQDDMAPFGDLGPMARTFWRAPSMTKMTQERLILV